jgi:hypothetical protein
VENTEIFLILKQATNLAFKGCFMPYYLKESSKLAQPLTPMARPFRILAETQAVLAEVSWFCSIRPGHCRDSILY